jgi:hypothetical protein
VHDAIDAIKLHDDRLKPHGPYWRAGLGNGQPLFNPVNPEDRDGDAADNRSPAAGLLPTPPQPVLLPVGQDRFDESAPEKLGRHPSDDTTNTTPSTWNKDGEYTDVDHNYAVPGSAPTTRWRRSLKLAVTGFHLHRCGKRVAIHILRGSVRPGWCGLCLPVR